MDIAIREPEMTMLKKILITLGAAAASLGASATAFADHGRWRDRDDERYEHRWHREYYPYYYAPRPVYVVPAPRIVYAPPPPVVYPYYSAPVVVRPAPAYAAPGVSIRFDFPL